MDDNRQGESIDVNERNDESLPSWSAGCVRAPEGFFCLSLGGAFCSSVLTVEGWSSPRCRHLCKGRNMLVVAILMV